MMSKRVAWSYALIALGFVVLFIGYFWELLWPSWNGPTSFGPILMLMLAGVLITFMGMLVRYSAMTSAPGAARQPSAYVVPGQRPCPACGIPNTPDSIYCKRCGKRVA